MGVTNPRERTSRVYWVAEKMLFYIVLEVTVEIYLYWKWFYETRKISWNYCFLFPRYFYVKPIITIELYRSGWPSQRKYKYIFMSSFHFLMCKNCCLKLDLLVYKRILWTHLTALVFLVCLLAHMLMRQTEVNSTLKLRETLEVIITCSRSQL